MKKLINSLMNFFGYNISRLPKNKTASSADHAPRTTPYCPIELHDLNVIDIDSLATLSLTIPGMVTPKSGQILYTLCYFQELEGDTVEVGSWQGRSTSFLAQAVKNSKNGNLYAIDHFKGNVGKEAFYKVNEDNLSDLKSNFMNNMKKFDLESTVKLLDMPNDQAVKKLPNDGIRFLFIDGDHTKEGVEKDINLFFPLLLDGALVVFDDFSTGFPGLITAIKNLLKEQKISKIMSYTNTLVIKIDKSNL